MRHEVINQMFEELYQQRQATEQKMNSCQDNEILECVICLRAIEYEIKFLERIEYEEDKEAIAEREGRVFTSLPSHIEYWNNLNSNH